ncbi:MAG: PKD domain-containing protein, partial [Cytophagaceae bacterium]
MKKYLLAILLFLAFAPSNAMHITGGEIIYQFESAGGSSKRFFITLRLFRDDTGGGAALPNTVIMGVYNNNTGELVSFETVDRTSMQQVAVNAFPGCMTNPPSLIYSVGYYSFAISLPNNSLGYTIAYQTCCRIDNISNVPNRTGATYTSVIPGAAVVGVNGDSSPSFSEGISVVCYNRPFRLDFSAIDPDRDSLSYSLCDAYDGGGANTHNQPANYPTPAGPPYASVNYINGYSGSQPMGFDAGIDPATGIISGIAPDAGKYVVSVCVNSFDRVTGRFKGTHRKDFIINVSPCDYSGAQLQTSYLSCDGFTFDFANLNTSPLNNTFLWDFGDGNTSTSPTPTHTYAVAGDYTIKLVINGGNSCSDSSTAPLRVYPGFFPGFTDNTPTCKGVPVNFNDITTATYGVVNTWKWDFGLQTVFDDSSRLRNPTFTYSTPGDYGVTYIVGSDKGCRDTLFKIISILDKAPYTLTNDTLICSIDTLRLNFNTPNPGTVVWSPNYMISNVNAYSPLVSPDVTTTYYV